MQGRPTRRPKFRVFGHHPTGSTGTVFLLGIMVGAVAPLELGLPAHRGHHARRAAVQPAFGNRVRDTRLEHQQRADTVREPPTPTDQATTRRRRSPLQGALVARPTADDHGWLTVSGSRGL